MRRVAYPGECGGGRRMTRANVQTGDSDERMAALATLITFLLAAHAWLKAFGL